MLKSPNHCPNLISSTFVIFFDHFEKTSVLKIQFLKSRSIFEHFEKEYEPHS